MKNTKRFAAGLIFAAVVCSVMSASCGNTPAAEVSVPTVSYSLSSSKNESSAEIRNSSRLLNVEMIYQNPELPAGCEVTSAAMLLQYELGETVDKTVLADRYLACDNDLSYDSDGELIRPNPQDVFVGSPYLGYYGCFANAAANCMNEYLDDVGSSSKAVVINNPDLDDIIQMIDKGKPVMVWASTDMEPIKYSDKNSWYIISEDGEKRLFKWPMHEHCLVICGYSRNADEITLNFCDPLEGKRSFSAEEFLAPFEELNRMAIVIK